MICVYWGMKRLLGNIVMNIGVFLGVFYKYRFIVFFFVYFIDCRRIENGIIICKELLWGKFIGFKRGYFLR